MDWLGFLKPIEWAVANLMVIFHHALTWLGLDGESGITWALSIVGLTITIRVLLVPLFVKQIKASRAMQVIAPDLRKIQDKYKGKKDQASREAMSRETMELYSKHKTNPFASCLPMLLQAPIFFALFRVLNTKIKADATEGIGLLTPDLAAQAFNADLFGARLSDTFFSSAGAPAKVLAVILIVAMVATTFLTSRQLMRKNMPAAALEGPMAQQQKIMMYALPFIFVITGPNFPIGVLIYWSTSNLWTMGQQFYVIRNNPTPGSQAEKDLIARREAKARRRGKIEVTEISQDSLDAAAKAESRQRVQPKRKPRSKRGGSAPNQRARQHDADSEEGTQVD